MKIALVDLAGHDYPGGCEKYFSNLSLFLSKTNDIDFWESSQYKKFMDYVYLYLFKRDLNASKSLARNIGNTNIIDIPLVVFIPFSKSRKLLRKKILSYDKIYVKNEFQELLAVFFLLGTKEFQKRVIIGVHTPIFIPKNSHGIWEFIHNVQYNSFIYKSFYRYANKIHVVTKDYINLIRDNYKVPQSKIIHIQNPIEWKTFLALNAKKNFKILWVGRLTSQKGLDRLEKIIKMLLNKELIIEITIAGDGEKRAVIEKLVRENKHVIFKGFVSNLVNEYKSTDLVIFTAYFDTFAHAVLEPQSYGIPVISFDIPGPRDIIENGKTGYLVKTNQDFVKKVLYYFNLKQKDMNLFNSLKNNIYKSTNRKFDKEKVFKRLSSLFY